MPDFYPPPATLPPGSICWAYLRDSGGENQERSVPQQEAEIRAYCERHNLVLAQIFADKGKSGGSVKKRDAFLYMYALTEFETSRPNGLLLWDLSRFSRNMQEACHYKSGLRLRNVVIHCLTEFIPDDVSGFILEAAKDFSNQDYREKISIHSKRGQKAIFEQGFSFGVPPRGYLREIIQNGFNLRGLPRYNSKWVPDPDLAPLVKLAFEMRAKGAGYIEILEATGLYKDKTSLNSFFNNKAYIGVGINGDVEIQNHHPALVDLVTWEAVKAIQEKTYNRRPNNPGHPRRIHSVYLLSGVAVCLHCGDAIIHDISGKNKWPVYLCGRKKRQGWDSCEGRGINAREADKAVLDAVLNQILTPDYALALVEETRAQFNQTDDLETEAERIKRHIANLDRVISRLLDEIEHSQSPAASQRLREREAERARFMGQAMLIHAKLEASRQELPAEYIAAALGKWRGEFLEARQEGTMRPLKNFLNRFVTKIELGYNKARIYYSYPLGAQNGSHAQLQGQDILAVGGTFR